MITNSIIQIKEPRIGIHSRNPTFIVNISRHVMRHVRQMFDWTNRQMDGGKKKEESLILSEKKMID